MAPVAATAFGENVTRAMISVGCSYFLSKRTDLHAVLMHDKTQSNLYRSWCEAPNAVAFAISRLEAAMESLNHPANIGAFTPPEPKKVHSDSYRPI